MQALASNDTMSRFNLFIVKNSPTEQDYYEYELQNAKVVGIRQAKLNILDSDNTWAPDMESVWFIYDSIRCTYTDDSIESTTNWDYVQGEVPRISDLNYDGSVNLLDLNIMASQWLAD